MTVRDLLTFTWGFGMQGAMFTAAEPGPVVTAVQERELSSFGPPMPGTTPEPDTWLRRLAELRCARTCSGPPGGAASQLGHRQLATSGASSPCSRV